MREYMERRMSIFRSLLVVVSGTIQCVPINKGIRIHENQNRSQCSKKDCKLSRANTNKNFANYFKNSYCSKIYLFRTTEKFKLVHIDSVCL